LAGALGERVVVLPLGRCWGVRVELLVGAGTGTLVALPRVVVGAHVGATPLGILPFLSDFFASEGDKDGIGGGTTFMSPMDIMPRIMPRDGLGEGMSVAVVG
jgi:hypothetical protein